MSQSGLLCRDGDISSQDFIHSFISFNKCLGSSCYVQSRRPGKTETDTMKSTVFDLGQFPTTFLITQKPQGWPITALHPLASAEAFPPQAFSSGTNRKDYHLPLGTPSWKPNTTSAKLSITWRENVCSRSKGSHDTE